jgi:hypothetical protein
MKQRQAETVTEVDSKDEDTSLLRELTLEELRKVAGGGGTASKGAVTQL